MAAIPTTPSKQQVALANRLTSQLAQTNQTAAKLTESITGNAGGGAPKMAPPAAGTTGARNGGKR